MIRSWFVRWCARYGNIGVSDCFDLVQGSNRIDSFWFASANHFIFDSDSFWFAIQFDFIHFDSVWFWFVTNHDSPANHASPGNQKSKVSESWFSHFRIIVWFDLKSKAIKGNRESSWSEPWTSQDNVFTKQINSEIYQSNFKFCSCLKDPKVLDLDSCHDFIWKIKMKFKILEKYLFSEVCLFFYINIWCIFKQ